MSTGATPVSLDGVALAPPRHGGRLGDRADAFLIRHARVTLAAAALLIGAVAVAWVLAKTTSLIPYATEAYRRHAYLSPASPQRDAALAVVRLADPAAALVTVLALSAYCLVRGGRRAALLPWAAAAVVILTTVAKHLPGRTTTLPSGHAAYATAVAGLAAWLLVRARHPWLGAAVLVLGLLMASARVIEGAHVWPDVVAGVALGLAWLLGVLVLGRAWAQRPAGPPPA